MSDKGNVRVEKNDGIATLVFDRPAKKNAFTLKMYEALVAGLREAEGDTSVRVVVLRGEGGTFTAGNDILDFVQEPPTDEDSPVFQFLVAITTMTKPLIAEVEGAAIGLGTTLLLHADLVYAADDARFQLPFINLGLVPEGASTYLLPRAVGHRLAAEVLMFGDRFDAAKARELGLVNRILPRAELRAFVADRAAALAERPLGALRETKQLLRAATQEGVQAALTREGALFVGRLGSPEAAEAFSAFLEKRKPNFKKIQS